MMKLKRFIKRHSEFLTIPLAVGMWHVFRLYAENAKLSIYDSGIFQKLIFAIIAVLVIKAFAWFMITIDQPYLKKFLDSDNERKWYGLNDKEKLTFASLYFLFYSFQLTLIVVLT